MSNTAAKNDYFGWFFKPCENGHVFMWTSSTTVDKYAVKGTACLCGAYKADGKGGILEKEAKDAEV
jgi:hypothetical protein